MEWWEDVIKLLYMKPQIINKNINQLEVFLELHA